VAGTRSVVVWKQQERPASSRSRYCLVGCRSGRYCLVGCRSGRYCLVGFALTSIYEPFDLVGTDVGRRPSDHVEAHGQHGCCTARRKPDTGKFTYSVFASPGNTTTIVETECGPGEYCGWDGSKDTCAAANSDLPLADPNLEHPRHCVAGDPRYFGQASGTSFSSPLAAAMGALLDEHCDHSLTERTLRAMMRTGAWRRNPEPGSSRYSSAEDEVDDNRQERDGSTQALGFRPGLVPEGLGHVRGLLVLHG
jgi:hypothetical protein